MSVQANPAEIVEALSKSGYLMEQQVATQLEALGFHVHTNWAFKDPDEKKSREIDVRAIKRVAHNEQKGLSAFVEILVECKNYVNPVVLITRKKNEVDRRHPPEELEFPLREYEMRKELSGGRARIRRVEPFFHLGFDEIHYEYRRESKAVQFCRIDRAGKGWKANHGGLYDAVFYPIAKAVAARKSDVRRMNTDKVRNFWFIFPMVVLSGTIYSVDSMKAEAVPEAASFLSFRREVRSGSLSGRYTIEFARQECVERFVADCVEPLGDRACILTTEEADFVLRRDLGWSD